MNSTSKSSSKNIREKLSFCRIYMGHCGVVVSVDESMRENVVSVAHGYGGLPDHKDYKQFGASTNLLISTDRYVEAINAMPRMTGILIKIYRVE